MVVLADNLFQLLDFEVVLPLLLEFDYELYDFLSDFLLTLHELVAVVVHLLELHEEELLHADFLEPVRFEFAGDGEKYKNAVVVLIPLNVLKQHLFQCVNSQNLCHFEVFYDFPVSAALQFQPVKETQHFFENIYLSSKNNLHRVACRSHRSSSKGFSVNS